MFLAMKGVIGGKHLMVAELHPTGFVRLLIILSLNTIFAYYYHKVMMKFAYLFDKR